MSLLHSTRAAASLLIVGALAALHTTARVCEAADQAPQTATSGGTTVTIYPLLVRAPIFGATVNLPSVPSPPGTPGGDESGAASGSTDTALNSAYMAGILVESPRWFGEVYGLWAALSADRSTPRVNIDSDTYILNATAGVRLFAGIAATGGVRAVRTSIDVTLTLPALGRTVEGTTKPTLLDPMIGVDWRGGSDHLILNADFQGGGFGVGTDIDLSGDARVRWRPIRHMEIRFGYSFVHFKETVADVKIGSLRRTLVVKQTLHGPEIGVGVVF
jgi:hypothetical protein